jgi:hypothetical protein
MINSRRFLRTVSVSLFAAPLAAEAQLPTKVPRIGTLFTPSPEDPEARRYDVFSQALREAQ